MILLVSKSYSCAKIAIEDVEFCGDAGELGAMCFHTLSEKERDIPKKQWDDDRFGMICTKSENFAHWKASIIKLCNETRYCTLKYEKKIEEIDEKVKNTRRRIGKQKIRGGRSG